MQKIHLPSNYSYVGLFLTLGCNLTCSYCINHLSGKAKRRSMISGAEWIEIIHRLEMPEDLAVTLQGGEPSTHPHFFEIIKGLSHRYRLEILTNLQFDLGKFMAAVSPERFARSAPYAAIRVSYHPETMNLEHTVEKVLSLQNKGYSIGLYSVDHPESKYAIARAKQFCEQLGVDFRTKEFLGEHAGRLYGTYKYAGAVSGVQTKNCLCKTSELLVAPNGQVHRCHHDLYNELHPQGSMLDPEYQIQNEFSPCAYYGKCNPCDVKVKNNRFQNYGYTSVEIKDLSL